jgi:hypothetical protein
MKVSIKKDEESGECFIDFDDIKHIFDNPESVKKFEVQSLDDGAFSVAFFDENDQQIIPNVKE